jgi:hypothetical protein
MWEVDEKAGGSRLSEFAARLPGTPPADPPGRLDVGRRDDASSPSPFTFDLLQECIDDSLKLQRLLRKAEVRSVLDDGQPRVLYSTLHVLEVSRPALVVATADQQCRHADLVQPVSNVPVLDRADHGELAGAVHVAVDLVSGLSKCALQPLRPRIEPADMLLVEAQNRRLILRA